MGRPYGIGYYGTHRYSSGSYVRLASATQAAAEGSGVAREVERRLWAGMAAQASAYAATPGIVVAAASAAGVGRAFGAPFRVANRKLTTPRADAAPVGVAMEANLFSATHLSAQATAYTSGRFAWEPGDVTDTGGWEPQDLPGTVWARQDPSPTEWN